jgi:hypothetical protein
VSRISLQQANTIIEAALTRGGIAAAGLTAQG